MSGEPARKLAAEPRRGFALKPGLQRLRPNSTATIILVFVALLILYFAREPSALSSFGIMNLSNVYTALALAAVGETFVVVMGGIDLSVGAVMSLVNVTLTVYMAGAGVGGAGVIGIALGAAILAGVINGLFVAFMRLPSIIVTLATMFVWSGVALMILPQPGGSVPETFVTTVTGTVGGFPVAVIILAALVVVGWYFVRTRFGMAMFAVGGNEEAVHSAGLPVAFLKLAAFGLSGLFYGLAGLFLTAQTGAGDPTLSNSFLLEAFAAVAIGGTAFGGGRGSLVGSVFGAMTLGIITDVLFSLGVTSFATPIFYGAILFIAVSATSPKLRAHVRRLAGVVSPQWRVAGDG